MSEVERWAAISECGQYRYELGRRWGSGSLLGWIMLNPSTADGRLDDPTIRRCMGFARDWLYGGILVRNVFALRATNPRELQRHPDPVGLENAAHLGECWQQTETVAAWGTNPMVAQALRRNDQLRRTLGGLNLLCLGTNRDGSPRHPLYVAANEEPRTYRWGEV